jgi:hypothetical protein
VPVAKRTCYDLAVVEASDLVGAWRLDDWTIAYDDGRPSTHPFGDDARGMLIYAAEGVMSVSVTRAERVKLSGENVRVVPEAERAAAFDTYFAYAGRWRLENGQMIHEVDQALNPNFVGAALARRMEHRGNQLILSAAQRTASGATMDNRLTWRRAGGDDDAGRT